MTLNSNREKNKNHVVFISPADLKARTATKKMSQEQIKAETDTLQSFRDKRSNKAIHLK
jgi:hypothetical protein